MTYFETIFIYKVVVLFPPSSWVTSATYLKSFLRQTVSNDLMLPNLHECVKVFSTQSMLQTYLYISESAMGKAELDIFKKQLDGFFLIVMGCIVFLMQCGFAFLEAGSVR